MFILDFGWSSTKSWQKVGMREEKLSHTHMEHGEYTVRCTVHVEKLGAVVTSQTSWQNLLEWHWIFFFFLVLPNCMKVMQLYQRCCTWIWEIAQNRTHGKNTQSIVEFFLLKMSHKVMFFLCCNSDVMHFPLLIHLCWYFLLMHSLVLFQYRGWEGSEGEKWQHLNGTLLSELSLQKVK